jgi:hypothetical protein
MTRTILKYRLVCLSFDGHYITEGSFASKDDAWERSDEMGSRWYFYPFHFVVTDKLTIVDAPHGPLQWAIRKPLGTVARLFKDASERADMQNLDCEEFAYAI